MENHSHYQELPIYKSFINSPYSSLKVSSYFDAYQDLFEKYRGKKITFVEVGILNGGSLFMWKDYFGPEARIIGLDFNPDAKKWESHGFEIFIGDQADPEFWSNLYNQIGKIDILLDDGGHTYEQQIATVVASLENVKDNGLIVVEDTHTSYFKKFGYPSKYTFISWANIVVDGINSRYSKVKSFKSKYKEYVYAVSFYESIVAFRINKSKCFPSDEILNNGIKNNAKDYRYHGTSYQSLRLRIKQLSINHPKLHKFGLFLLVKEIYLPLKLRISTWLSIQRARKYFE